MDLGHSPQPRALKVPCCQPGSLASPILGKVHWDKLSPVFHFPFVPLLSQGKAKRAFSEKKQQDTVFL